MAETEILKKILLIITSGDVNKTDEENHDVAFLAMQLGEEELALNIINNTKFNRTHLNMRNNCKETLLATASYFGCAEIVKILVRDKKLIKITNQGKNPYCTLTEPFFTIEKKNDKLGLFSKEELEKVKIIENTIPLRLKILDMLLCQYELTLTSNDFLGYILLRDENYNSRTPFSESKLYYFSKNALEKIISNCKCKTTEWLYDDNFRSTALGNVAKYCSLEEVDLLLKRDDIDINKTFPATRREYFSNAATSALGCDSYHGRIFRIYNCIREDVLYRIVLDKRFSSVLALDVINRLEYSEVVDKEKIINNILVNKEWPKEDIYDETALALAFYHDDINYKFLINYKNVRLKTITLEFISRYASKYQDYYNFHKVSKKIKEASIIKDITDLELTERTDRWTKEEELTYDTIVYKHGLYVSYNKNMGRELEKHFLEQEHVRKLIEKNIKITNYNLSNYVPNRNINVLSYIINENDVVKIEVDRIREVVKELLNNYHYIERMDNEVETEKVSKQKKKYLIN